MSVVVSAPGKAFLIGEYAVLEGATALITALDVRAVAHRATADRPAQDTAVVRCAHARATSFVEALGVTAAAMPVVETGGFTMGHRKLGLGSSAAVTAAVVGYHLASAGLDPADGEVRCQALALAHAAHAEAQGGGGSGADVATAVLGGMIQFSGGTPSPIKPPSWLALGFVDAGAPAVTSSFVAAVKLAGASAPQKYRDAMALLCEAADLFASALAHTRRADGERELQTAVALHVRGLRALQAIANVPILTAEIEGILGLCAAAGVAAKPSGAGGGDLVVLVASERAAIDRLAEPLRERLGRPLLAELRPDPAGLRAEARLPTVSRLGGFFRLSIPERHKAVAAATGVSLARLTELGTARLDADRANHMIENVVGTFDLPLAIATNFRINGRDVLVPMCVEEASVVAAASNAAKMIRDGGGFAAHSDPPWMIAQVQLCRAGTRSVTDVLTIVREHEAELLTLADATHPRLVARGGGARAIESRVLADDMAVVHVLVDCQDAMGANLLNTVAEAVAVRLEALTGWAPGLRILSNLADRRCAHVSARVPAAALAGAGFTGPEVVARIASASRFAELDPYRAATHNKGIMNGVDAVVLATGNDWRAMEASAHAFAAAGGRYGPLARWVVADDGYLEGKMSLPAAVGVVGGATQVHPVARIALEILGHPQGAFLGQVMAATGLASNLAALRALATEGIQRGHMSLHARSVALAAGAVGDEVERVAACLVEVGEIKADRAVTLLAELRRANA